MDKPKLLTKNFLTIAFVNFFMALSYYLLMVTISAFSVEHFHSSHSQAGLASGMFMIAALFGVSLLRKTDRTVWSKKNAPRGVG